ncbi:serine/threonine-protein kinase [Pseudactinotalea sp.]|uniref:serine/threonine-protein kinase n=1 Tax=Pseudactinotalea sp. TaxID=1926260 RepID=UPI003B3AFB6A
MSGERLGRYRLDGVIGVGSFATVHRAHDAALDDEVVVKVLAENHSLNPQIRERFLAEGRTLRRVASAHVVAVHDIGESDRQQPYLVLEHADRGTLAARVEALRAAGRVATAADVLALARPLAAAVEAVHARGIVHRDLSPGNVLLSSVGASDQLDAGTARASLVQADERLVVADLGMCKDLARSSGLTVASGTVGFRAPEQDGPGVVDIRADIWAMSALLLWVCERMRADADQLPARLFRVLKRGAAASPRNRHPDARRWLAEVEKALTPPPVQHEEPARDRPRSGWLPRRSRRLLTVMIVLLAVGAGLLGGLRLGADPVAARSGEAGVFIDGPEQATVGESVTFRAVVDGPTTWVWQLPNGSYVVDEETVTLTARTPGDARLVLRSRTPDGVDLEVVHLLEIVD